MVRNPWIQAKHVKKEHVIIMHSYSLQFISKLSFSGGLLKDVGNHAYIFYWCPTPNNTFF